MNLIILAAGQGKRLYPLTKDRPKTLLDIGRGTTLLGSQLDAAASSKCIDKVYIVTGYLSERIEEVIRNYKNNIPIETIYNPYFDLTNALFSLWTAHYVFNYDDFLISNGDNFYHREFFDLVNQSLDHGITSAVSKKNEYAGDDMKIRYSPHHKFERIGKDVEQSESGAVSVGLLMVKGSVARNIFHRALMTMVKHKENRNAYWQDILNFLAGSGETINATEIPVNWWAEVDFHPDADILRQALIDNMK